MLQEYGGRILRVNFSDKPKPRNQPLYPETEHKLFIGNLAWTVTTESLTQAFQQYGNVVGARVVYDGETGRSRGYAFVSYATRSEMEAALESLNGVVYSLSLSQTDTDLDTLAHPYEVQTWTQGTSTTRCGHTDGFSHNLFW